MKKTISNLLYVIIIVILCLSTIYYYQESNRLIQTNYTLENENKNLEQIKKELLSSLEKTKGELQQLKNEPSNLIVQIRNAYENKNYEDVKKLSQELHFLSNGTEYDVEAQKYVSEIEKINNLSDIKKAQNIIEINSVNVKKNYYYASMFKDMTLTISYKINTDKIINSIVFSISALDINGNKINFYTNSSNFNESMMISFPSNQNSYKNTWTKDWNNLSISKIQIDSIYISYIDGSRDYLAHHNNLSYKFGYHLNPLTNNTTTENNKTPTELIVYITNSGSKYHRSSCSYLSSKISINKSDAIKKGYTACSRCNP